MNVKPIEVYPDSETKRRIEVAAAKHDVPVTDYILEAIKQQLIEDEMLEQEQITIPVKPVKTIPLIAELRELQEEIKAQLGGKVLDIDKALDEVRALRSDELFTLP